MCSNNFLFVTSTRFLEKVYACCVNKKTFQNFVLRHQTSNQATPFEAVRSMLSAVASGFLFRIIMMFLKSNQSMITASRDK